MQVIPTDERSHSVRGADNRSYFGCFDFARNALTTGERVESFGVALDPGVVDHDALEAPFLAVAHQLAIVAVHQERVLGAAARTFPRHEMLRHDIRIQRRGIAADFATK